MRHLIDFGDLPREEWDALYARASQIIDRPQDFLDACRGKVACSLFYEPSTRTNFSFQTAMLRLGGSVFGFADPKSSSVAKGETLKDTIKMVSAYSDVVVMRNPREGAAKAASLYSEVPVINAGDGGHMHPTQTMTDLTTITKLRGSVDGLSIGLCGDLKNGRTVHSLIKALAKFQGVKFYLISPRELAIPEYLRRFMKENGMWNVEVTGLETVMSGARVFTSSTGTSLSGPGRSCWSCTPCPGWTRSTSTWTTTPVRSTSSRPVTVCSPAWLCLWIWPTSPAWTRVPWRSVPGPSAITPTASPRPSTISRPW